MQEYRYRAMDAFGKVRSGTLVAKNELEVEHRLENQGLDMIACNEHKRSTIRLGSSSIARRDIINMVFHLEQLTRSGVPLLDALMDLRDSMPNGYYRDVLTGLIEAIAGGKNFSGALAEFPQDFDEVFRSLIAVGEESGELPRVLREMGENLRWSDELIAKTRKILMYPSIVTVVVLVVFAFMMIYLVPKIVPFVTELGGEIPFHTQALIAVSDFVGNYWYMLVLVPLGAVAFIQLAARSRPEIRYIVDRLSFRIPIFGRLSFKIKLARFSNYMALLYASGVTLLRSLEICEKLVGNTYMADSIHRARQSIAEGGGISDSFASVEMFPPLIIRMLRVGENTGDLDKALENVSYFYNREIQETIDTIEPAIAPVLTIIMGSLLGWIMLSVLGPVWDTVALIG